MIALNLFIGNSTLLSYDNTWKRLIDDYEGCGYLVEAATFPQQQQQAAN